MYRATSNLGPMFVSIGNERDFPTDALFRQNSFNKSINMLLYLQSYADKSVEYI